jgi:hypothetical protein
MFPSTATCRKIRSPRIYNAVALNAPEARRGDTPRWGLFWVCLRPKSLQPRQAQSIDLLLPSGKSAYRTYGFAAILTDPVCAITGLKIFSLYEMSEPKDGAPQTN